MNLKVQRFSKGHKYFVEHEIQNDFPEKGVVGIFGSIFGQLVNADTGEFICYTLERKDTLISEGKRKFILYNSPANHSLVLLFEDEPGSNTFNRKDELHIANWCYQLKGCTAVGSEIDLSGTMLTGSSMAFKKVMQLVNLKEGTIIHETI